MFQQKKLIGTLNSVNSHFLFTPTDKANWTVVFINELIYAFAFIKELGPDESMTRINETYIPVNKTNDLVISNHNSFLKRN